MSEQAHARQWLIAVGLSFGPAVSNGLARFAYGLVLPAMQEDLSWSYTEAGWINTANALGYLIGAVLAFTVIPTIGPRRLFLAGLLLTTVALFASGLTHDFWLLTLWRILAGIGGAPVFIAGGAMASALFRGDTPRNALAIAVYFGGGGLGMVLSGMAIPPLLATFGISSWPESWLMLGVMGALMIVPSGLAAMAMPAATGTTARTLRRALPLRRMLAILSGYFLFAVGYIVYITFLVAWMQAEAASVSLVAATWAILGLSVMLSPFPWKGMLTRTRGGGALGLACAATGLGTLIPLLLAGPIGLVLSAAVFGLSFFIAPTAVTTFGRKNLPERQWGRSVALFTTVFAVGQTLGPVAAGFIADVSGSLSLGLVAAGIVLLAGGLIGALQKPLVEDRQP